MLSSRIAAAVFGAIALAAGAFAVAPASAAPVSAGVVHAAPASDLIQQAQYYGRPVYRPRPYYGRPVYRPRPYYGRPVYRPRCFISNRRVWTGYHWVVRPVRVCR